MKYLIAISIETDKAINAKNLQHVKSMAEESVIEHLAMPEGVSVFVNAKVTKQSD